MARTLSDSRSEMIMRAVAGTRSAAEGITRKLFGTQKELHNPRFLQDRLHDGLLFFSERLQRAAGRTAIKAYHFHGRLKAGNAETGSHGVICRDQAKL